jgi:predicted transcriptional regulator
LIFTRDCWRGAIVALLNALSVNVTHSLEKAFEEASKLSEEEQDVFAEFILDELAFRAAVREGIEAADRGEVVTIEQVKASQFLFPPSHD